MAIEHYTAKSVDANLSFEWSNLLPACRKCNVAKAEHDHAGALLKPDEEDPEPFFWIHPDTGKLDPHPTLDAAGRIRAEETIRICDLQRPALCTQRAWMLSQVGAWIERLVRGEPAHAKEWQQLSDPRREFKLVLRHMLRLRGLDTLVQHDQHRFASE